MSGPRLSFLLRPKWIAFHVLVFGSIALMIWLSLWQFDRLDERRAFNELVSEQIEVAPVPLEELLAEAGDDPTSIEWRQALVSGTYLSEQVLWFNRSQDGLAGDNVLTAMVTDADHTVVVNRGFVPLGFDIPAPPTVETEVLARVRLPQDRQRGELTDSDAGWRTGHRSPPHRPRPARRAAAGRGRARLPRPDRRHSGTRPERPHTGADTNARRGATPVVRSAVVDLRRVRAHRLGAGDPPIDPHTSTRGDQGRSRRASAAGFRPARRRRICQFDDRNRRAITALTSVGAVSTLR